MLETISFILMGRNQTFVLLTERCGIVMRENSYVRNWFRNLVENGTKFDGYFGFTYNWITKR